MAATLGARPREIVFTGCGTDSDNQAIKGVALANRRKGDHIITSRVEHKAVLQTCEYLEKQGFRVTYLTVDEYVVNPEDVAQTITDQTISLSMGVCLPESPLWWGKKRLESYDRMSDQRP